MSNKILVLGANGMLGGSIHRYLSNINYKVLGTVRSASAEKQLNNLGFKNIISGIDVLEIKQLRDLISEFRPDYIINCIGLIKQLPSASQYTLAIEINSLFPHKIAEICDDFDSKLIHFSTDCVFSGSKGNYTEESLPDSGDLYGRSKLLGEIDYGPHLTLRTSIIGHELNSNISLIDWFLSQEGAVKGFSNAIFSGLPTIYIAEFLDKFILKQSNLSGLYHLSTEPIDKYSLLKLVKSQYGLGITIEDYPDFVINRSLNCHQLKSVTGFTPPTWPELIKKMYDEYELYFK